MDKNEVLSKGVRKNHKRCTQRVEEKQKVFQAFKGWYVKKCKHYPKADFCVYNDAKGCFMDENNSEEICPLDIFINSEIKMYKEQPPEIPSKEENKYLHRLREHNDYCNHAVKTMIKFGHLPSIDQVVHDIISPELAKECMKWIDSDESFDGYTEEEYREHSKGLEQFTKEGLIGHIVNQNIQIKKMKNEIERMKMEKKFSELKGTKND